MQKVGVTLALLFTLLACACAQGTLKWCAVTGPEMSKCNDMMAAFARNALSPSLQCIEVKHESQCLRKIQAGEADVKSVTDRGIFTGGKFSGLKPVISETREDTSSSYFYRSVIVVRKDDDTIQSIADLKNKRSCHTGVMRNVGWNIPVGILNVFGGMTTDDCDNNVKNVADHFQRSCAPGAYEPYNDPDNNNPPKICQACDNNACPAIGEKYSGYNGAFRGLVDGVCDVAFVKHSTVPTDAKTEGWPYNENDYELLCPGTGPRQSVRNWENCNWATRPHRALMARSFDFEVDPVKELLDQALTLFGPGGSRLDEFQLFNSSKYGAGDLIFSDSSNGFNQVPENDYISYLGAGYVNSYENFRPQICDKNFRWCTISSAETRKCKEFRMAMSGGRITEGLTCIEGTDVGDCFNKVQQNQADLLTVDADDVYFGGRYWDMRPIAAELYDANSDVAVTYFAVAVIRAGTNINLNDMRGKKSCHTGYGRTVGWRVPVGYYADRRDILYTENECHEGNAAAQFFGDMCAPGALQIPGLQNPAKLCALCPNNCQATGIYSGYTGAVRCLKEKTGDVAFVKHDTIEALLAANESWASGWNKEDFRLACRDGTIKTVDEWASCYISPVPAQAVVTHQGRDADHIRHYQIALDRARIRYSNDNNAFFAMFDSEEDEQNLLFRDNAQSLVKVNSDYQTYLGSQFMSVRSALDPQLCAAKH